MVAIEAKPGALANAHLKILEVTLHPVTGRVPVAVQEIRNALAIDKTMADLLAHNSRIHDRIVANRICEIECFETDLRSTLTTATSK